MQLITAVINVQFNNDIEFQELGVIKTALRERLSVNFTRREIPAPCEKKLLINIPLSSVDHTKMDGENNIISTTISGIIRIIGNR